MTARLAGRSRRAGGAALVLVVYLLAAVATLRSSGHPLLPLFEGVGPPAPYQWVNPPAAFAPGNIKPGVAQADFALTGPPRPAAATTPDGQFVINLTASPFPPHPPDTKVHSTITPLDPATLGLLPPAVVADGNAYRLQLTYEPSGTPVTGLAIPGNVVISAPHQANSVLYSPDGQSWTALPSQLVSPPTIIGASFRAPGWFVVGTSPSRLAAPSTGARSLGTAAVAALAVGAAIALGGLAVVALARRRRN